MKHTIWTSDIGDLKNWQEFLDEYYPDADESEQYQAVTELNNDYLDDERINLNIPCRILAIAELGLWNGIHKGFKFYDNISEILYSDCEDAEWYVEDDKLKAVMHHHDGTNYISYYLVNDGVDGYDDFEDEVYATYGNVDQTLFDKYCDAKALANKVNAVYGWN